MTKQASLTELELAFNQNPESTAYIDLCRAYIAQARFMEALVICKKGLKAHPDSVDARVLLGEVYAAQKKYKRALQELDELVTARPESAEALLARAKVRLEASEEAGAVDDLKRAIDLAPGLDQAKSLLLARGIVYPEPAPPPPSLPASAPPELDQGWSAPSHTAASDLGVPVAGPPAWTSPTSSSSETSGAGMQAPFAPARRPQRLEGEEELEELANQVANERPAKGRPSLSILLLVFLLLIGAGVVGYRFNEKKQVEAIDRLTGEAVAAFNQDTYGSYKKATKLFEEILERYDANNPSTLSRLAHAYAILWGEHGEKDVKPRLDAVLAKASAKAQDVSHTIAATGLVALYDGKDRQAAATKARAIVSPAVEREKSLGSGSSYADLTLAIIDLELGNYDEATETLSHVKQVLPGSVRAKVWHARAAFRSGRFGTAEAAFREALRAQPNHPGARAGLALVQLERGDLNGAAENLIKFDEIPEKEVSNRDRALAEYARSAVFRSASEDPKALGAYENAIRFDPDNADFPYGLGRWLLQNQRAKEALEPLKKAVAMEKTRWSFLIELAEAEMSVGDFKSAEEHIEEAVKKAPTFLDAALAKARLMRRLKRPGTEDFLKKMTETWPNEVAKVNLELGRYYRTANRLDEAKVALEKAIDAVANTPSLEGEAYLSYARLMEDRDEREVALKTYQEAAQHGELEAWFRTCKMLAHSQSKDERKSAKDACDRYLAGGSSLVYSNEARVIDEELAREFH